MKIYGLTGGIASGKSTVAKMFAELGARRLDADALAKQATSPGQPAYEQIVEAFGREILQSDGTLDRRKLRRIVFADEALRERLNAIVHPAVMAATAEAFSLFEAGGASIALYEAALLVETGMYKLFNGLIVVDCPEAIRRRRLMARDGVSAEEAEQVFASQATDAERRQAADFIIDASGSLDRTRQQVRRIWTQLT
ncbi:MAG: dephospho-CoA kinase [Myxococcales bacterium]|nr:MAG: dephospho-CoA kinase [Myxococcales bacterium]